MTTPKIPMTTPIEKRIIRALMRLDKIWPKELWLYSANGTLNLMRKHPDGSKTKKGEEQFDHELVIERFPRIENDGGDW